MRCKGIDENGVCIAVLDDITIPVGYKGCLFSNCRFRWQLEKIEKAKEEK